MPLLRDVIMQSCTSDKTIYCQDLGCYALVQCFSPVLNYIFSTSSLTKLSLPLLLFTAYKLRALQAFFSPLFFIYLFIYLFLSSLPFPLS